MIDLSSFQKKIKDSNIRYLVIASDSQEFRAPDLDKLKDIGIEIIFDGRNILNLEDVKNYKFKYFGIYTILNNYVFNEFFIFFREFETEKYSALCKCKSGEIGRIFDPS